MNLLSMGMEKMPLSTIAGSAKNALLLPGFVTGSQKQLKDIGAEQGVRRVLALLYPHDICGSGSTSRTIPRGSAKRLNNSLIFVACVGHLPALRTFIISA